MGRRLAWLLTVPLALMGSEAAHSLDYSLVAPNPADRARLLSRTGHSYLDRLPFAIACAIALVLLALVLRAIESRRGRPPTRVSYWGFGCIPPVAFVLQEHLERLFHDGAFPWTAALEPSFGLGLVLTAPAGLLAYLFARALLQIVDSVARPRGIGLLPAPVEPEPAAPVPAAPAPRRIPVLARLGAERGPPDPALS